ncbi:hypothetical protein [Lelliottia nimipressuralis]
MCRFIILSIIMLPLFCYSSNPLVVFTFEKTSFPTHGSIIDFVSKKCMALGFHTDECEFSTKERLNRIDGKIYLDIEINSPK